MRVFASITIPTSYVEQFSANVHMLSEQRMSRLRPAVMIEEMTGESFAVERIGTTADSANDVTELHGDTPLNNTPHTRRWGFIKDKDVADLIDKQSRVKLLISPDGPYTIKHAGTMGRSIDDEVISALGGTVASGKDGTTLVALPAAQKVVASATGMTVAKLTEAKEILDAAEVDEFFTRYVCMQSRQISNLLEDDKISSQDYNTVKALVRGEINEYLGFNFIRSQRLQIDGSSDRLCYAWAQPAIRLALPQPPTSEANTRPDKRNAKQIYTYMSLGATRVEDEMVVEIACTEA